MVIIILVLLGLLCLLANQRATKTYNLPPGPIGLPIIGNLWQFDDKPVKQYYKELSEKYGRIFSLKYGSYKIVVLNHYKDIRDAFTVPAFSGRPVFRRWGDAFRVPRGIVFNTGDSWVEQRNFTHKKLRKFGLGKGSIESIILVEVQEIMKAMNNLIGNPLNTSNLFDVAVVNVLWTITAGGRLSKDNVVLDVLLRDFSAAAKTSRTANIRFFPLLYTLFMKSSSFLKGARDRKESIESNQQFMNKFVEKHKQSLTMEDVSRDFIDEYLKQISQTCDLTSTFYKVEGERNLLATIRDIFAAGTDSTAKSLSWILLLLAVNQDVQTKLFQEVKKVVGLKRLPTLNDRSLMPFTQAVISETLRFSSVLPLGLYHSTTIDVQICGFDIPKDTIVISNLYGAMHDTSVWANPEAFMPERFLSPDNKTFLKHEAFLPFSCGNRVCLGMSLALDQLFLFVCCIFQKFEVIPDPNGVALSTEGHGYLVSSPKPHTLLLRKRYEKE